MKKKDRKKNQRNLLTWIILLGALVLGVYGAGSMLGGNGSSNDGSGIEFTDARRDTRTFMAYNKTISLTPDQEAVRKRALTGLRAPCCSDRTAYTCCCSCNMAKSWWGLSKYLIGERGYGVDEVREAVAEWIVFINPDGFSGNACYTSGCNRPFRRNGCGGMSEKRVIF